MRAAIEPAAAADLEALAALERESFTEPWSAGTLAAALEDPLALLLTVRPAPAAPLAGYALFRRVAGEAELLRLAVDPGARRRGLGAALVGEGLARLRREGVERCFLEVRAGNAAAVALYARCGFTLAGVRRRYYADGEDALVFSRVLAPG